METGYHLNINHKSCTGVRQICCFISNSYCPPAELVFIRPFCFDWHSFLQLYRYLFLVSLNEGTRSLCKGRQQSNSSSWVAKQIVRWLFRSPLLNRRRDGQLHLSRTRTNRNQSIVADSWLQGRRQSAVVSAGNLLLPHALTAGGCRVFTRGPRDKILTPL